MHDIVNELDVSKCLWELRKKDSRRFHSPGHKGRGHFLAEILDIRCDEDNVVEAKKTVKSLEERLKDVYGAKGCRIYGGMASCAEKAVKTLSFFGEIAVTRNCPEYVFSAFSLLNIEPIIIDDDDSDEEIRACISRAKAVIISSPDIIFGKDDQRIKKLSKELNKKLMICSDYGGGYVFTKACEDTFDYGCDIAVFDLSKVLPCFSGCSAVLAFDETSGNLLDIFESEITFQQAMSLEYGVYIYKNCPEALSELKKNVEKLKQILVASDFSVNETDFKVLSVNTKEMGISGKELEARLNDMGIYVEYADAERVVFTLTVEDEKEELTHLAQDLIIAAEQCGSVSEKAYNNIPKAIRNKGYLESVFGKAKWIDVEDAEGETVANNIFLENVGRAVLLAGDKITKEAIDYIDGTYDIKGLNKGMIKVLK